MMRFEYGWENGKLLMEKIPLSKEDIDLLNSIMDIAFIEMGERTRMGSGDDQYYADGLYNKLKQDNNSKILVEIVFRLCKQAEIIKDKVEWMTDSILIIIGFGALLSFGMIIWVIMAMDLW